MTRSRKNVGVESGARETRKGKKTVELLVGEFFDRLIGLVGWVVYLSTFWVRSGPGRVETNPVISY